MKFTAAELLGMLDDPALEERSQSLVSEILAGPERESVLSSEVGASSGERVLRDWVLSEQEFKRAGEAASEGRGGAALGWGLLGLAAAVPLGGQVARGVSKAVGVGADVARSGKIASGAAKARTSTPNPRLKEVDDLWHNEARLEWLPEYGRAYDEYTGEVLSNRGMFARQLDELEDALPGITEFSDNWASATELNEEARNAFFAAFDRGGKIPDSFGGSLLEEGLYFLERSPTTRAPAYRAATFTPEEVANLVVGKDVGMPLSSFTYLEGEARNFVGLATGNRTEQVMFRLKDGTPAIPIGAIAQEYAPIYGEIVTAGRFRVSDVSRGEISSTWSARMRPVLNVELEYVEPFTVKNSVIENVDVLKRELGI